MHETHPPRDKEDACGGSRLWLSGVPGPLPLYPSATLPPTLAPSSSPVALHNACGECSVTNPRGPAQRAWWVQVIAPCGYVQGVTDVEQGAWHTGAAC